MPGGLSILGFIVVGIVAGWIAGLIMKGSGFGVIGDLIIGVVGAIIGGSLFSFFGIAAGGVIGSLVMSVIGAVVLLFIAGLFHHTPHTAV